MQWAIYHCEKETNSVCILKKALKNNGIYHAYLYVTGNLLHVTNVDLIWIIDLLFSGYARLWKRLMIVYWFMVKTAYSGIHKF